MDARARDRFSRVLRQECEGHQITPPARPRRFLVCVHCPAEGEVAPESPVERWVCPSCLRGRDHLPD